VFQFEQNHSGHWFSGGFVRIMEKIAYQKIHLQVTDHFFKLVAFVLRRRRRIGQTTK
jgi:hypothetical protein